MAVIDDWTDDTVDTAIRLLVLAERLAETHAPDLHLEIRRFLLEEA
jgi:hypothetical protein